MDPAIETEDCWMQWDALPDTTCATSTARGVRVGGCTTIGLAKGVCGADPRGGRAVSNKVGQQMKQHNLLDVENDVRVT